MITRGADTLHVPLGNVAPAPSPGTLVVLGADTVHGERHRPHGDRTADAGRARTSGSSSRAPWCRVTGWSGDFARVRLDASLEIWVSASEARAPAARRAGAAPRRRRARGSCRSAEWVDFIVPTGQRPAFLVEEGAREIMLTLYDTPISTDLIRYAENDSLVRLARVDAARERPRPLHAAPRDAALRLPRDVGPRAGRVRAARAPPAGGVERARRSRG